MESIDVKVCNPFLLPVNQMVAIDRGLDDSCKGLMMASVPVQSIS